MKAELTKEEFQAWRAHPVTALMRRRATRVVEESRQRWLQILEDEAPHDDLDQERLTLQARMFAYADIAELDYDTIMEVIETDARTDRPAT